MHAFEKRVLTFSLRMCTFELEEEENVDFLYKGGGGEC